MCFMRNVVHYVCQFEFASSLESEYKYNVTSSASAKTKTLKYLNSQNIDAITHTMWSISNKTHASINLFVRKLKDTTVML